MMIKFLVCEMWCPMFRDIRMKPCPRIALLKEINEAICKKYSESKILQVSNPSRLPEHSWLMVVLSTIAPEH